MNLTDEDAKKFYQFFIRYNIASPNIGIIGDKEKFEKYTNIAIKQFENSAEVIIKNEKIVRILQDDIEYCYIQIENTEDLRGKYFRKFV